jgi:hypothetical protein
MREPPRKLDVADVGTNPDVTNVRLYLNGVRQTRVLRYDMDEGWLVRHRMKDDKPVLRDDKWLTERIRFEEGELVVKWFDDSRVQD